MANETITAPEGFSCGVAACGIKNDGSTDIGLLVAAGPCTAAAMFTSNRFCGAPIVVGREHVRDGRLQAVVVNSGCSNVATGAKGVRDAREMCRLVGESFLFPPEQVLPSSTGVIGRFLPMKKVTTGIIKAAAEMSCDATAGEAFARAIMTTDRRPKQACTRFRLGRSSVTVAGCCKGSGMIAPNMATMLAYLTTDANVPAPLLQKVLHPAVERTFNRVTVDECQSTSDTVAVLASGLAGNTPLRSAQSPEGKAFASALYEVCASLAYQIAQDGEGATRVIEVCVRGARTPADAHGVARTIAVSPLVKTAVHGGDPNWGRIVQALGTTSAVFSTRKVRVYIGPLCVFERGEPVRTLSLPLLARRMKAARVTIAVELGAGRCEDRVLTCDLSREYVTINADYTT
jgi:glutamate N-acetyltransferase/amino-acid N-acetyltransferase